MKTIEKSIVINAPIEKVFEFQADPRNTAQVAPQGSITDTIKAPELPLKVGDTVVFRLGRYGTIESKITKYEHNKMFVDQQISGPLKELIHTHIVEPVEGGTRLTERFEYELRYSIFGKLADLIWVRKMQERYLEHHQKKTKEILERVR